MFESVPAALPDYFTVIYFPLELNSICCLAQFSCWLVQEDDSKNVQAHLPKQFRIDINTDAK